MSLISRKSLNQCIEDITVLIGVSAIISDKVNNSRDLTKQRENLIILSTDLLDLARSIETSLTENRLLTSFMNIDQMNSRRSVNGSI